MKSFGYLSYLLGASWLSLSFLTTLQACDQNQLIWQRWEQTKSRIVVHNTQQLAFLLKKTLKSGMGIEIGGADNPFCRDCLQVDRYASQADMMGKLGINIPKFDAAGRAVVIRDRKFAAAQNGIIADAAALPFKKRSLSVIVSKNFPWFLKTPQEAQRIELMLSAYQKVLTNDGMMILLNSYNPDILVNFANHIRASEALGYQVDLIYTEHVTGILVTPKARPFLTSPRP